MNKVKQIDFEKAYNTRDLQEFLDIVFPDEWKPIVARIIESGAEYRETDKFAPKWTPIPFTKRNGRFDLETQMKSVIFRVHDCLHQLWGLPIPSNFDNEDFYLFKRAWMCAEIATLTLTEFVYAQWLYDTQPDIRHLLENRNTLNFKNTTELRNKTTQQIAMRLDELLHKKIQPKWVRENSHALIFVEDYVKMLEDDRNNIDHNWQLLLNQENKSYMRDLPNQRYSNELSGLELTVWMIDDFYHLMNTDSEIDVQLASFNRHRRQNVSLPDTWNVPSETFV